jgi:beta-aspartyl-peptidase (threonine type)
MTPRLIVHGGAWNIPDEMDQAHLNGVHKAIEKVYPLLVAGMSALEAVEAAVNSLEADPTFDAGKGSFLNEIGEIELDAMIMDGRDLNFGAVAAVQNILHPVSLAKLVMEKSEHAMLVGRGAQQFADQMNIKQLSPEELLTERELTFYDQIKNDPDFLTHHPFEGDSHDTVGAVALDVNGNLAAATSTGGTARKAQGRVGDSPIIGAGAYADNQLGAASATGWGESIMKVLLTKALCDYFVNTDSMQAAKAAIELLSKKVNGLGGVIGINAKGQYGFAYNTPKMAFAYANEHGEVNSFIKYS